MKTLRVGLAILMFAAIAAAQSSSGGSGGITVSGAITAGHCAAFATASSIQDSGGACSGSPTFATVGTGTNTSSTFTMGSGSTFNGVAAGTEVMDLSAFSVANLKLPGALVSGIIRVTTSTGAITSAELSGDATTSGSNAVTVVRLNGTSLAGLGTGLLKNTTGTGVPSIGGVTDITSLFSGCSGTQYLGADGACHSAGTGTVTSLTISSPLTGGTITTTGTIGCATCATTTSGGALSGTSPVAISSGGAISITGAAGQVLAGSSPAFTATPTLGTNGSTAGTLGLANGNGGGATVTLVNNAATSPYNFIVPATPGAAGQVLTSQSGSSAMTWTASLTNPMTIPYQMIVGGASGATTALSAPTTPNGVPQVLMSTPSGGVAGAETWGLMGVPVNAQTGTTYTVQLTDRTTLITASNSSAQTYTATNPSTSGFGNNFPYIIKNIGTGAVTENASGFNINGGSSLLIPSMWTAFHWSDNTNLLVSRLPDFGAFGNCPTGALSFTSSTGAFGCNSLAFASLAPTPTRPGDLMLWNGSVWTTIAGNNSGTQILSENSSGVASWTASSTGTVTSVSGTANELAVANSTTTPTISFTNPTQFPGAIYPPAIATKAYVDGVVNTTLAQAAYSAQCFGASGTKQGCEIEDDTGEVWQYWPLLGSRNYTIKFGKGTWWTTVPILDGNDQFSGAFRPLNSDRTASTSGTRWAACQADTQCSGLYFPTQLPAPPQPVGTAHTSGSLASGTYNTEFEWVVQLNTGPDSIATASAPSFPTSTAVVAGQFFTDATTNCSGSACTEVVIVAGTTGSGTPSWNSSVGGQTTSGATVVMVNVGNISTVYGLAGVSLPGTAQTSLSVSSSGNITYASLSVPAYPTCATSTAYGGSGQPRFVIMNSTHLYVALNAGTSINCAAATTAGAQSGDATGHPACSGLTSGQVCWQEVGSTTNYISPVGYLLLASKGTDPYTVQTITNYCGASGVNLSGISYCPIATTANLTAYTTNGNQPRLEDSSAPLVGLGEDGAGGFTSFSIVRDMVIDARDIATQAVYRSGDQENSTIDNILTNGGLESSVYSHGPNSVNSKTGTLYLANDNNASGPYYMQRLAGYGIDGRSGEAIRATGDMSINLYSPPPGANGTLVPYGLFVDGSKGEIDAGELHCEDVAECAGAFNTSGTTPGISLNVHTIDATITNTVGAELGANVGSIKIGNCYIQGSGNCYQDDTIAAGTGNCNSNNSNCFGTQQNPGGYQISAADSNGNRMRLPGVTGQTLELNASSTLRLDGSTSGNASIGVAAAAGTPSRILLPTTDPSNGAVLTAATPGGGTMQSSWAVPINSIATTSPITGGTVTSGAITVACATCITSASPLASNGFVLGSGGAQGSATVAGITSDGVSKITLGVSGTSVGGFTLNNTTSGSIAVTPAAGALGTSYAVFPSNTTQSNAVVAELGLAQTFTANQSVTTQAQGDNSTKVASTAYVDGQNMIVTTSLTAGHAYYISAANTLSEAGGGISATAPAVCVAINTTQCLTRGTYTTTGLTAGAVYYVPTASGVVTSTAPSSTGQFVQRMGVALSTTVLIINPSLDVGTIQ